ncbi:hypothetical protein IWW38_000482 [Coemansia aciculifera]|uniref:Uncharacterized protein n=1 Tax=Coemansia aciculifera TaxID=417176 RepID=A0ACC1M9V2_9FUNG|nr:hypothetical protein IWW38_000482 [Coemansia aciculifera]
MSRALYFFRNIRTKQVLACPSPSVMSAVSYINTQITNPALRPTVIRPDHWTPLVVVSGFESEQAHADAFTLAAQPGHPLTPPTADEKRQHALLTRPNKRLAEMDMVERQVAQLARALVYMDAVGSRAVPSSAQEEKGSSQQKIKLFWEDDQWIGKVQDAGLSWPKWVEHDKLELKRGNVITNKELRHSAQ